MPQIKIQVREADDGATGERKGTFTHPPSKVKTAPNSTVNWNLVNPGATFKVRFRGFRSPFSSGELDIDNENPRTATNPGVYHYAVQVTKGQDVYTIEQCPEFEVG